MNRNKLTSRLSADVHAGVAGAGDGGPAQAVLAGHLGLDVWKKQHELIEIVISYGGYIMF